MFCVLYQAYKHGMYGAKYVFCVLYQAYKHGMYGAKYVFCVLYQAYKHGMYGAKYVWLLLDWYDNTKWWLQDDDSIDCTQEQMTSAVQGYFSIESVGIVSYNTPTLSGMVSWLSID